jgi:ATP-dependent helicase HrpA
VDEAQRSGPGDVLVFLPGEREIREAAEALRKAHHAAGTEILPLFAASRPRSRRGCSRPRGRRVVLATNVAETSLTVPGIRYVVDTGLARVKRYSHRNKVEQLQIEKIAQSAAASAPAAAAGWPTASASASTTRTTSTSARPTPTRKSCARRWPG